jgi:ribosome-binding factor A
MSRRTERVASTIQQELAQIIMRELNDPRITGLPSITRVKVSPDLSIADVFMSVMGTEGQQTAAINALRHSASLLRLKLTKQLTLRIAPFLKFHIDENLKRELNVLALLDKVRAEREEAEQRAAATEVAVSEETSADGAAVKNDAPTDSERAAE